MGDSGVRGILIYCANYHSSHSVAISGDGQAAARACHAPGGHDDLANAVAGAAALALGHQGVVVTRELLQRVAAMPRHEKAYRVGLPQADGAGEHGHPARAAVLPAQRIAGREVSAARRRAAMKPTITLRSARPFSRVRPPP